MYPVVSFEGLGKLCKELRSRDENEEEMLQISGAFAARNALSHAQKNPPAMQAIVTTVTVTDVRQPLWMS